MGYEIHITRRASWIDDVDTTAITLDEWKDLVTSDPDMRLDNYAEATTPAGETIGVHSDGLSVWTKYSGDGLNGNHAWFDYDGGNITVRNSG